MALSKSIRVLSKSCPPQAHSVLVEHRARDEALLLESSAIVCLSSAEADTLRKGYTKVADAYACLGVLPLAAGDRPLLFLGLVTGCCSAGKVADAEVFRITQTALVPLQYQASASSGVSASADEKIADVKKLLNSGTFYFCKGGGSFELSQCAQRRTSKSVPTPDNRFFWNRAMFAHPLRFGVECDEWLVRIMCGSVEIRTVYCGKVQARALLVSRLSCERAGTRFNVRGANDDGNVANFVETEQAIYVEGDSVSYLQTRGSVPVFWEQPGLQVGSHKVKMSRGYGASRGAFERHFDQLRKNYGSVAVVNLLATNMIGGGEGEATLSEAFQKHVNESYGNHVEQVVFDYHREVRCGAPAALARLGTRLAPVLERQGYFLCKGDEVCKVQRGVLRTNCLDCLDRTNSVQLFVGLEVLKDQLASVDLGDNKHSLSRFEEVFRQMWVNNGNEISKIYAGTGAIQGGSKIIDGARSAARTIQNNLLDSSKQEAIDVLLLGSALNSELADRARILLPSDSLHVCTSIQREMCRRYDEYVSPKTIRIGVGTYNVNGGKHFRSLVYKDVSLSDWLLDSCKASLVATADSEETPVDIYAVGFEEIVDLNASNIMAASTENAKAWAEELEKVLSRDRAYSLLSSLQLVGVCLYIFIRPELTSYIRDVAVDCVKTGLGGATGNKGATAIRLVLHGTSMCFVCAHFAAGQSQVNERNADYSEITRKVAFPMGRTLNSHDYVFWCGDFNYRIDMDKEELKESIRQNELGLVLENDQLNKEKGAGNVFKNCFEGDITFPPTYKYDLFSEDYDTSEKCRAPAWTDRVLWKSRRAIAEPDTVSELGKGKLIYYGRAELKQSDHRPVIAILDVEVSEINPVERERVFHEVIKDMGPPDGTVIISPTTEVDSDDCGIFTDELMASLLGDLNSFGEVTLVRFHDNTLLVTFREGQSALLAAKQKEIVVCSETLKITLKCPDWLNIILREIELCSYNTVPLYVSAAPPTPVRPAPPLPSRIPPSPGRAPPPRPAPPPSVHNSNNSPPISPHSSHNSPQISPSATEKPAVSSGPPPVPPPPSNAASNSQSASSDTIAAPPSAPPPPPPVPSRQAIPPPLPARPKPT